MTVTMPFTPRVRALLIILVLACVAGGVGVMVLGRSQDSTTAPPLPRKHSASTPKAPTAPVARPSVSHPALTKPQSQPQADASDSLPSAIQQALSDRRVVVVELFDPRAKIDDTALNEASAGAQLAGSTFVPIDVTTNEVDSLNRLYGVIQDPAVLVLRPPGDLVVQIDGFADRDTVAQAALNATS